MAGIGDIPDGALLCTVDVVGLYPSIPHDEGLEAMRRALNSRQDPSISTGSLVNLGKVVLENNVFEFGGRIFRQKLGTAIGTKFAPAYANLFMADLEKRLLDGAVDKPLVWLRYIDDVFLIWTHGKSKLDSFLEYLNGFHQTTKFTSESSMEKVSFLDVMVVKRGGILETDLYCKTANPLILISICRGGRVIRGMLRRLFRMVRLLGFGGFVRMMVNFWLGRRNWLVGLRIEVMMRALLRSRLKGLGIWTGKC